MESDLPQPNTAIAMNSDGDADHFTHPHDSSGLEYHPDSYDTGFSHCAVPATQNPFRSIAEPSVDLPLELDETRDNEGSQHDLAIAISTDTETDQSSEQREVSLDQTKEVIMSGQREETESERQRRIRSRHPIDYILAPMPELSDAEEVLAALRGARADEDITNKLDEMQKIHYKQRRHDILMTAKLLIEHKQFIKEKNVDKFMKMIDECVKYLRWRDDSPFDEDDCKMFLGILPLTLQNVWPREFGDDEETVFVWRKLVNHILDGDLIASFKEMWSKVESTIQRLETGERGEEHVWGKMTEEEKRDIDLFETTIAVFSNFFQQQGTTEIWAKITVHAVPYVFKCLESILVHDLVSDSDHPQVTLVMSLLSLLSRLVQAMEENMPIFGRKIILDTCYRFHESSAIGIHFLYIQTKALCFTLNELKDEQPKQMNLKDEDTTLLLVALNYAVNNGSVKYSHITFGDSLVMTITLRYLLLEENQIKLLEFRFEETPDMGLIDVILKGIEKNDKKLQIESLVCLKIVADDEELIEHLKSNEKCLPALKGCRKSPHMSVRQKAVDVIMKIMIRKPKDLKVTRKRLERSSCISWSEGDVRNKMKDCGFVVPAETNITGCDGEWLVELLVMRREINNTAYYKTIESRFGIKPDETSINFNLCMRKLEKLILTEDFSHEPDPYQSLN